MTLRAYPTSDASSAAGADPAWTFDLAVTEPPSPARYLVTVPAGSSVFPEFWSAASVSPLVPWADGPITYRLSVPVGDPSGDVRVRFTLIRIRESDGSTVDQGSPATDYVNAETGILTPPPQLAEWQNDAFSAPSDRVGWSMQVRNFGGAEKTVEFDVDSPLSFVITPLHDPNAGLGVDHAALELVPAVTTEGLELVPSVEHHGLEIVAAVSTEGLVLVPAVEHQGLELVGVC